MSLGLLSDRWRGLLLVLGLLGVGCSSGEERQQSATHEFEDVLGHKLTWRETPRRIVSLSPNLTEILFAIGCDTTNVVGVTRFCNYPPQVRGLPKVGGIVDPNLEAMVVLAPDLVLATRGNALELMESLSELRIPVYAIETQGDLDQIFSTIEEVGRVVGREQAAVLLADSLRARAAAVALRTAGIPPAGRPRIFVGELEGAHWTAGPGSYIHALITTAGGVNVGEVSGKAWSPLTFEAIVVADPEIYLGLFGPITGRTEDEARDHAKRVLAGHEGWRHTSLGRQPRVYLVHEDRFQRPGPRIVGVLEELAAYLHPSEER